MMDQTCHCRLSLVARHPGAARARSTLSPAPTAVANRACIVACDWLADIAQGGRIIQSLAAEGGLQSTLWAGPEAFSRAMKAGDQPVQGVVRKNPVSLRLGFSGTDYVMPSISVCRRRTRARNFQATRRSRLKACGPASGLDGPMRFAVRNNRFVRIRNDGGEWREAYEHLASFDSMMTHCGDPRDGFELLMMRERMRDWRFYDHLRTDREAPARRPQIGTYTPVLASDGSDLAAAVQTIREIGDAKAMKAAIADAFPGARVEVTSTDGYFELEMYQHGPASAAQCRRIIRRDPALSSARRRATFASAAYPDDPQRT